MKARTIGLLMLASGVTGYAISAFNPVVVNEPLMGYTETACSVIRYEDGSMACSVRMNTEDDDYRIFRGLQVTRNPQPTVNAGQLQGE